MAVITGTIFNDILNTTTAKDTVFALSGDDLIYNNFDDGTGDVYYGGSGVDTVDTVLNTDGLVFNINLQTDLDQYGNVYDSIENVRTGSANDSVLGDSANNRIETGGGNDVIDGGEGKDVIFAGAGDDLIRNNFDDGTGDVYDGGSGVDTVDHFFNFANSFAFDVNLATDSDNFGNTYTNIENVIGANLADTLRGDGEDNRFDAMGGEDRVFGGSGEDVLRGGDDNDSLFGGADDDNIDGQKGSDLLYGGNGDDMIFGSKGADKLRGQKGDDMLEGGLGNDTFQFKENEGTDNVVDWKNGNDKIRIWDYDFSDLSFNQNGADLEISFTGTTIVLEDSTAADVSVSDFIFT